MPIECVVFDLGNVLVKWDRRLLYEKLIADPRELDRFLDEVLTLEVNAELDRGEPLAGKNDTSSVQAIRWYFYFALRCSIKRSCYQSPK